MIKVNDDLGYSSSFDSCKWFRSKWYLSIIVYIILEEKVCTTNHLHWNDHRSSNKNLTNFTHQLKFFVRNFAQTHQWTNLVSVCTKFTNTFSRQQISNIGYSWKCNFLDFYHYWSRSRIKFINPLLIFIYHLFGTKLS